MKLENKRLVAKEVILFYLVLGFLTLSYLGLLLAKSYYKKESRRLKVEMAQITVTIDSMVILEKSPLYLLYFQLKGNKYVIGLPEDYSAFYRAITSTQKARAFYDLVSANDKLVGVPEDFEKFSSLIETSLNDSIAISLHGRLIDKRNELTMVRERNTSREVYFNDTNTLFCGVALVIIILVYPIRFLIQLLLWALLIMRQKI
jgi:hypothetical protein